MAIGQGMDLMVFSGLRKAREGTTTLEEVMRVPVTDRFAYSGPS